MAGAVCSFFNGLMDVFFFFATEILDQTTRLWGGSGRQQNQSWNQKGQVFEGSKLGFTVCNFWWLRFPWTHLWQDRLASLPYGCPAGAVPADTKLFCMPKSLSRKGGVYTRLGEEELQLMWFNQFNVLGMSFPGPQALVLGAFHYLVLGSFDGSLKLLWAEWLKQSSLPSFSAPSGARAWLVDWCVCDWRKWCEMVILFP